MTFLRYEKAAIGQGESRLMVWSRQTHKEEPITAPSTLTQFVYEWSADGKQLLASLEIATLTGRKSVDAYSRCGSPIGPIGAKDCFPPNWNSLWDSHFSPDGRWIILVATANTEANIYVIPASGGPWSLISKGQPWAESLADRTGKRFTSFPPALVCSMSGVSALIQRAESQLEISSV